MTTMYTWIALYFEGYALEWSTDGKHWLPVIEEPYAGDGKYYRRVNDATYPIQRQPEQQVPYSHINQNCSFENQRNAGCLCGSIS